MKPRIERLSTELLPFSLGPFHPAVGVPIGLCFQLDGEIISSVKYEVGFLHRGLEKTFENQRWVASIPYCDRLDPEAAPFGELSFCLAVEEIAGMEIPTRAQDIRILVCELSRVCSHLGAMARIAQSVESETAVHYLLRDREKVIDLFELLTGARFMLNFFRIGGVVGDVTEGFLERVLEFCDLIGIRIREYNDLFSFNHALLKRGCGVGVISREQIQRLGITGPNARASGEAFDVRKTHPYSQYERYEFSVPIGKGEFGVTGDCHDRFLLRLREIGQSVELIRQVVERISSGPFRNSESPDVLMEFKVKRGEAFSRVETPRGMLGCHVVSDGGEKPWRVGFRPPSAAALLVVPELLVGHYVQDVPIIFSTLDLSIAEVDR